VTSLAVIAFVGLFDCNQHTPVTPVTVTPVTATPVTVTPVLVTPVTVTLVTAATPVATPVAGVVL
jgi:hypothetical protein